MSDRITRDELSDVSGGATPTNKGGKCKDFTCEECRAKPDPLSVVCLPDGTCIKCAVSHESSCVHADHKEGSCGDCIWYGGGTYCNYRGFPA